MDDANLSAQAVRTFESISIVQRLESLMRQCREEGHTITYRDLLEVRYGIDGQGTKEVRHVSV